MTTLLGFFFFDMVYISVIITYASQSELIQFYIMSIIDRVNTKAYSLEDAMKVGRSCCRQEDSIYGNLIIIVLILRICTCRTFIGLTTTSG